MTVDIYLKCLLKLIEEHNYDIYVHPVRARFLLLSSFQHAVAATDRIPEAFAAYRDGRAALQVPPVLDVTRPVVVPYVERLRAKTVEAAGTPGARGRLHYLDFFDALLAGAPANGDKRSLKAEYTLDGAALACMMVGRPVPVPGALSA